MMDNIQILYASWCNTDGSDKVWGYFYVGTDRESHLEDGTPVFVFYGARNKALQLQQHCVGRDLVKLVRSKERKGYNKVWDWEFNEVCPNFYSQVDEKLTYAILAGHKYKAS